MYHLQVVSVKAHCGKKFFWKRSVLQLKSDGPLLFRKEWSCADDRVGGARFPWYPIFNTWNHNSLLDTSKRTFFAEIKHPYRELLQDFVAAFDINWEKYYQAKQEHKKPPHQYFGFIYFSNSLFHCKCQLKFCSKNNELSCFLERYHSSSDRSLPHSLRAKCKCRPGSNSFINFHHGKISPFGVILNQKPKCCCLFTQLYRHDARW